MSTFLTGSFVSDGTQRIIPLRSGYDVFSMVNITDSSTSVLQSGANTNIMRAWGSSLMAPGTAFLNTKTNGSPTLAIESMVATGGFTFFDYSNPPQYAATAITGITAASPAVVTSVAHGLAVGDTVRLYGLNGTMQSMNGQLFTVDAVGGANSFTISFDASGAVGGTPATAGYAQKVVSSPWSPSRVNIGPTATVSTAGGQLLLNMNTIPSLSQNASQYSPFLRPYQVGAYLRFYLPSGFGMQTSANFLLCQITQINTQAGYANPNQLQLQIVQQGNAVSAPTSASSLSALTYPAGTATYRSTLPHVVDIAEKASILSEAEDNTGFLGVQVGTSVQTSGKLYQWFASKGYSI